VNDAAINLTIVSIARKCAGADFAIYRIGEHLDLPT
jgi:hypothetical protein